MRKSRVIKVLFLIVLIYAIYILSKDDINASAKTDSTVKSAITDVYFCEFDKINSGLTIRKEIEPVIEKTVEIKVTENEEGILKSVEKKLSYDPFEISTFTAEDYDIILFGTSMEGLGSVVRDAEVTYGVNGMFILGVARGESSFGSSKVAKNHKNLFGIMYKGSPRDFDSFKDCIIYFCNMMTTSKYYKGKTIEEIATKYCPSGTWASLIYRCMDSNYKRLKIVE